jgi:hypothetical protein
LTVGIQRAADHPVEGVVAVIDLPLNRATGARALLTGRQPIAMVPEVFGDLAGGDLTI